MLRSAMAFALGSGLSSPAFAQDAGAPAGFNAHGFQLAAHDADIRDPLVVQRAGAFTAGDYFIAGLAEYAKAPLVLVEKPEFGDARHVPIVDNLVALNVSAGVALHDHVRLDAKAPVYFLSTGGLAQDAQGPALGDVRASGMVMLIRPRHVVGGGGLGFAVVGHVDVPSGTPSRFLGAGAVAGGGRLSLTYEFPVVTLSADVGTQFNPAVGIENLNGSDQLLANAAIGLLASDHVGFNFEVATAPPYEPPEHLAFPAEGLVSMRYKDARGVYVTLGGAAGLTSGPGVAAFRGFLGLGFGQVNPQRQADFDVVGALHSLDLCPLELETVNGYKDDDGCPDQLGALAVDVRFGDEPWEADATITGPEGSQEQRIGLQGLQIDAIPGTAWAIAARADGCLYGAGKAVAAETGTALVVKLEPKLDAQVRVEVVGPDDLPVQDATVTWDSDLRYCIPADTMQVNEAGQLIQSLAAGAHKVTVTAPGHTVFEQDVTLVSGDEHVLRVQLDITRIRVEKQQIVILEKVHFETAKAVIKPESFGLLNEVADTILNNPDLGRVEVAGHTDSRGSDAYNLKLSQDRAEAVQDYLVRQGVPADQLVAVGYGETRPIDTNKTDAGREANRRVEFNLIDRQEQAGEGAQ